MVALFSPLVYLCFYFRYSKRQIEKDISEISVRVFFLWFPLNGFIVSGVIFRSLTHFEFIFVSVLENVLISFSYR